MSEWKETELGQIANVQTGPFGSQLKNEQYITGGTPVVTVEHIKDFRITDFDFPSITNEDKERLSKYLMKTGDILFTRVGSVDLSAYVSERQNGWMFSSRMLRVRPNEEINSRFLSYYFQQKSFRDYILNISVGATMPSINTGILKGIPISYPPLPEQTAIASVLSSLDNKIDLLHRQNATLEKMAETLFREWFVEESKQSWEEVPLESFLDFLEGPGIRNWQYTETGTPFINIRLINNGDINVSKANYVSNEEANGKYSHFHLKEDDMIVSTSGTLGKNAIVRKYHLPLILNTSVIRFRPKDENNYSFMYQYLNSKLFQEHLESAASGSVQANFGPTHLKDMNIQKPSIEALKSYSAQADPLYLKLKSNQNQIRTLTALRDTLLPNLMSGEVLLKSN